MGSDFSFEDAELLKDLGVVSETAKARTYTALEERMLAGFEDIERFVEEHGRLPRHGNDNDIFERLYAIRLDRILEQEDCLALLETVDKQGILAQAQDQLSSMPNENMTDSEILDALGVEDERSDVTNLTHVRPRSEKNASAEDVARRERCADFDRFQPIFERVQDEINSGTRPTVKYKDSANYKVGDLFIVNGQKALIAGMTEKFITEYDRSDKRLRVIYDNGTEAGVLLRSLQRALNRDANGRRVLESPANALPLFASEPGEGDIETGHIYVVRSKSDNSFIAEHRDLIHKIGMTKGDIKKRLSGAKKDPTFLLADVELVASYALSNINPTKLENLLHAFFVDARLDLKLQDRFGEAVTPREWFMLPLGVIDGAIDQLCRGNLEHFYYDGKNARLVDRRS